MLIVKLIRRWGFAVIAFVSLLILAACIGAEVFALSAKDIWSYETVWPIDAGSGFADEYWGMQFATGSMLLEHVSSTSSDYPFRQLRVSHEGEIYHRAVSREYLDVNRVVRTNWGGSLLSQPASSVVGSYHGFGHGNLGAYYWKLNYSKRTEKGEVVGVPIWPIGVVAGLVLVVWEMRHWIHRRLHPDRAGMCLKCGYDLRASPERCPECGTAINAMIAD